MKEKRSFGTHDGSFHSDEVAACALLILFDLVDIKKIYRTRDYDILKKCEFIADVGGVYDSKKKMFDHHQIEYRGELSSAGMVLKYLKDIKIIDKNFFSYLNDSIIKGIDLHDTGNIKLENGVCSFSQVIFNFSPIDSREENFEKSFFEALNFTLGHLERLKNRFFYFQSFFEIIKKEMDKNKKYLFFEKYVPWLDLFFENGGEKHKALFIIMPTKDQWKLRAIPPSFEDRMNVRVAMPEEWAGLRGDKLKKISGIPGAVFCHKGRFISIFEKKEDAIEALKIIFKKEGIEEDI